MFGRKTKPETPPTPPPPPPELSAVGRSFAHDGALDPARIDPSHPLIDLLRDGNFTAPRPLGVEVDGEFGWESGDGTTPDGHVAQLFTTATAVMRDRGVGVTFGEITGTDAGLSAVVDGDRVVLASFDQPGSPVFNAVMGVLVALNTAAQRAGTDRRWFFAAMDDGCGPALFLTPEQAAGVGAETDPYPDGTPLLADPQHLLP